MNNNFNIKNFNANNAAINLGGTVEGDQIGTNHNQTTNAEVKQAVADLQALLADLETQHPQVSSEQEASAIIEAEFTEIRETPNHRLAILRKQILNPERHLQAIKATSIEVAKSAYEKSILAKAVITYLDKLSETPDRGL
ncbi:hypothetical protein E1H12_00005 [Geitlerinema sp. P-1104]|uniref:hypothetical protein n=1 Tax=Geitlerinema sp. P-1104 TaxID=2546230 RepID=UPI001477029F|nr:hypothetical protein [Geitlerinema sp. P-1104]NMG56934.1 hypothetical protein [Geitlerinema sp. P-1104]